MQTDYKSHIFQLLPKLVGNHISDKLYRNTKRLQFVVNYQLVIAGERMEYASLDAEKLARFLEMPCGS